MSSSSYLERHAVAAAQVVGPGVPVSITFRHAGAALWVASSSERAARCDRVEARTDEGPCLTAMRDLAVVLVTDVAAERRWPHWRSRATEEGFGWFTALPAAAGDDAAVALNVYSESPPLRDVAGLLAGQVVALGGDVALRLRRDERPGAGRGERDAPSGHDLVDRAVGVLMQGRECGPADALRVLDAMTSAAGLARPAMARRLLEVTAGDDPRRDDGLVPSV